MVLTAGTKLDGYEVLSLLGAGGMGEVYRARDPVLRREVAIKVLPSAAGKDTDRLRRFEQEAQAAAALNHPNILAVFQFGSFDGAPYLVSELLVGETLRETLLRGPMPVRKAVDTGVQVARGLAAAHEKGIVHRDLKPENLFVTTDGRVKILDFGLAKLTEPESRGEVQSFGTTLVRGTEPGVVMGTAGYMSPEQVRGMPVDHRTDIFAFGAVLYEMLVGKRAFAKGTSAETMSAILNEDPPATLQTGSAIPPGLLRVVHRCLEKAPGQRFQSASDLAFALESLTDAGTDSGSGSGPTVVAPAFVATRRRWPPKAVAWPAGIVAVLALAAVAYYFLKPKERIPFEHYSVRKVIDSNQVQLIAISPDGNYLAAVIDHKGVQNLMLHHIPTGSERVILQNENYIYDDLTFSPDGSYLYFAMRSLDRSKNGEEDEYRIPVLGGQATRVAEDLGGFVSFIDDGQRLCLLREDETTGTYKFLSALAEGGDEQVLATGKKPYPNEYICAPDGKFALISKFHDGLLRLDFLSGSQQPFGSQLELDGYFSHWHWAPGGKGLFVLAWEKGQDNPQVAYLSYPDARLREITNDPDGFKRLSVTTDGKTIATTKEESSNSFEEFTLSGSPLEVHPAETTIWFTWVDSGRIVESDHHRLRLVDLATNDATPIDAPGHQSYFQPSLCGADSLVAAGQAQDGGVRNIYKMHLDGSQATRLTNGKVDYFPKCTADGKWLFYADNRDPSDPKIMRQPLQGGTAQTVTNATVFYDLSPDGKLLVAAVPVGTREELQIIAVDTLRKIESFPLPPDYLGFGTAFSLDSKSFYYTTSTGADTTVWQQPLNGAAAVKWATFPGTSGGWLRPSPDGKKLGILFRKFTYEAVLLHDDTP